MHTSPLLADATAPARTTRLDVAARIAPRAVGQAALIGIAADTLLRQGIDGAAFPVWIAILLLAFVSLVWRAQRDVSRETALWLCVAALSSCGLAWRDAGMLKFLDVVATLGALVMAAIALASPRAGILAERFRESVWAVLAAIPVMVYGIAPNVSEALREARGRRAWESGSRRIVRSALLAVAMLVVFGSLLRSADPIFASLVSLPDFDLGVALSHVVIVGLFAWLFSGWANSALGSTLTSAHAPSRLPFSLDTGDLTSSLGVLNVLFGAFMLAQLGWLFGGESFLRARTGLTAAEYARNGFFEMIWVVVLVIPLLVLTRAALVPGRAPARRHTLLSVPLILLLGGIIASAAGRMQLYVHYYGLTVDRFYPLVLMGWLTFVLAWLAATVLRNSGQRFIAGCAASAFLVLVAINVAAPDGLVARFNERRATASATGADVEHMSELSAEAVDVAIRSALATPRPRTNVLDRTEDLHARCSAALKLVRRWGPESRAARRAEEPGAWRNWNAGEAYARRAVGANMAALRNVAHASCSSDATASNVSARR
jgi:hypothetical protein